jgi:hypothetical protein
VNSLSDGCLETKLAGFERETKDAVPAPRRARRLLQANRLERDVVDDDRTRPPITQFHVVLHENQCIYALQFFSPGCDDAFSINIPDRTQDQRSIAKPSVPLSLTAQEVRETNHQSKDFFGAMERFLASGVWFQTTTAASSCTH